MPRVVPLKLLFERLLDGVSPRRRELARLRAKWGKPGAKDGWLASRYFDLMRVASAKKCVDEKTWIDLEFPKIFAHLDSTETPVGGQVLFRQLREYVNDPKELAERYASFETLRSNPSLCEELRLRLATLRADSNAAIAGYLFGPPPEKPKYFRLIPVCSLLSVATLVAVLTLPVPIWPWLAVVAINTVIVFRVSPHIHRDAETLRGCYQLLRVADGLASFEPRLPSVLQLQRLVAEAPQRAVARKALQLLSVPRGALAESLYLWLNLAFLVEVLAYARTIDRFLHVRMHLASAFESVGSLDAAVAVASYLEWRPDHCQPELYDARVIALQEGYHPLIDAPVTNSIRLAERSALITGSNMAGKTTFIKMVGINVIFGRSLGFCFAKSASIPSSSVMASIRGEHSVESGKSHYFAEIEAMHSFIESARRGDRNIFVIDELFNGTNTVERLAAARAVLESFCQNAQVLVTTHDVELQDVLSDRYDLYHFQEDPDVQGFFDFRLRSGATRSRNAIRMLERMGFPSDVVMSAMAYAASDVIPSASSDGLSRSRAKPGLRGNDKKT